nr:hypothetical protein [Moorella glycerini]
MRYIRGGVTLDAADVTADANGIKKLPAGTFIGKKANGKYAKYVAATKATLTTGAVADNNAIVWTAKQAGVGGNNITITLVNNGASLPLKIQSVNVATKDITIQLATDAGGVVTSTAQQVIDLVKGDYAASSLVDVANATGSTGAGVVAAVAATNLAGGTDANVTPTAILAEEVIFTSFTLSGGVAHSDQVSTAIDHGRVITARLPQAPDDVVKANIPGVTFV